MTSKTSAQAKRGSRSVASSEPFPIGTFRREQIFKNVKKTTFFCNLYIFAIYFMEVSMNRDNNWLYRSGLDPLSATNL